ncbi:hypothetical protein BVX93_01750 [bacterium B13(2017)]|nr:hypothetical protein BVX93_01750 [bacterium B13(2017)]
MQFIGRNNEINALNQWLLNPSISKLTAVYGRRRIGKTRLIEEASKNNRFIKFEGLEGENQKNQIKHAFHTLYQYSGKREHKLFQSDNWIDFFILLSDFLEKKPTIVLFDEFQWMACEKTSLVSRLKYAWDNYFLKNNHVHLILCGSVSSFIVKKVINSKALYGRIDLVLHLQAMSLKELGKAFMHKRSIYEQLEYYLAVGGIPKYFELFNASHSTQLNLQRLCFSKDAFFFNELQRLFVSHFGKSPHYQEVVHNLADKNFISRLPLINKTSLSQGGSTTRIMDELELADFIESYGPIGNENARILKRYRLLDYFLRFYYSFIFPLRKQINSSILPIHQALPEQKYAIWKGLSFEHFCRQNEKTIASILGFKAVRYEVGSWYQRKDLKKGAQIDLLFKRADNVITLCEVKNKKSIDSQIISQVEKKVEVLLNSPLNKGKHFTIEKVLISVHPPPPAIYNLGFFSKIISLEELIEF